MQRQPLLNDVHLDPKTGTARTGSLMLESFYQGAHRQKRELFSMAEVGNCDSGLYQKSQRYASNCILPNGAWHHRVTGLPITILILQGGS
ncbi:hypothetical protein ACJZ2D_016164 [Fusarium nematophilum]